MVTLVAYMGHLFLPFKTNISGIELPEKFTYPFNYTPHLLSEISAKELQDYIRKQTEWEHNFGLESEEDKQAIGKMFGVLVCENQKGELGQLWAFSGKLAGGNQWSNFVPTVFDMLEEEGFYKKGEAILNGYNAKINALQEDREYVKLLEEFEAFQKESELATLNQKQRIKELKGKRNNKREKALLELSADEFQKFSDRLNEESKRENIILKKMNKHWKGVLDSKQKQINVFTNEIEELKLIRKQKSADLQQQLFREYTFLNVERESKDLGAIFNNNPPAGAGECCAPKLLHYAFKHQLKPVAMAEFWWGKSPGSEIRKHQNFYPSCRSKCEPILLQHMLSGLDIEDNPLEIENTQGKEIEIIYEDDWLAVINKPYGLLSVPGKRIKDSVHTRMKQLFPLATGPLVVHRLDRATSGLMIIAKDLETYIALQKQFTARTVKKRYIALLDGVVEHLKGKINLPLRVDLDNRPQQLVCYKHGKNAITEYEVIEIKEGKTLIYFYPITGRTHQLRVHSAHFLGLTRPIVGDDLYGKSSNRLCLHAEWIEFIHPVTKSEVGFEISLRF